VLTFVSFRNKVVINQMMKSNDRNSSSGVFPVTESWWWCKSVQKTTWITILEHLPRSNYV